ncbi:mechanosensitive ion channel domain-containing protein [Corynebacterium flavescens]|uniref:mechanosensitive ion channel domain-containing protein n=1 Tax=Corynebacterium flavescens TaxID=28028 RepID=UPI000EC03922|nr:mechanosensitive ion channel protein MscS [Corynebacterium flavescens]
MLRYYFFEFWQAMVDHGLPLLALLIIAVLIPRVGRLTVRILESKLDESEESTKARLALAGALIYVLQAAAYLVIVVAALANLGVPPLGAAIPATVVSAAIGFGAQTIIGDFLAGFFILSEKQFGVGDYISIGDANNTEGTVVALTLRTTKIRTPNGEVVTVPNGQAGVVSNFSQDWSRAVVDLAVPVLEGETVGEITQRVESVAEEAIKNPTISKDVAGDLEVLPATGVVAPTVAGQPWQVNYRVMVVVNPARQWAVERAIRSALLAVLWDHYSVSEAFANGLFDGNGALGDIDQGSEQQKDKTEEISAAANAATSSSAHVEGDSDSAEQASGNQASDNPKLAPGAKDDGPGGPSPVIPLEEDESAEPRKGIWRDQETHSRWEKIVTLGGRVRASTTELIVALVVVGWLILASSSPEDGQSGWLAPSNWREGRSEAPVTSSEETPTPSLAPTSEPVESTTQQVPTQTQTTTGATEPSEFTGQNQENDQEQQQSTPTAGTQEGAETATGGETATGATNQGNVQDRSAPSVAEPTTAIR